MYSESLNGSFHEAIGPILKVAHFFGVLPVDGVNSLKISCINFRWKSVKTIYSLVFILFGIIECLLFFRMVINRGITLSYSSALSFYSTSMLSAICLFNLGTKWKRLMKFWYQSEKVFLTASYTIKGLSLKRKIRLWAATIGFLAFSK